MKKEAAVKQYISGVFISKMDFIVQEEEVILTINGLEKLAISMSPEDLRPFAYGFLLTSGIITTVADVGELTISGNQINLQLNCSLEDFRLVLSSGCGSGSMIDRERDKKSYEQILLPDLEGLPGLFKEFNRLSMIFEETGGIHSAAITDGRTITFFAEDIGRHNAVDKVIGKALLDNVDLSTYFLLTSGRISGEIVKKVFYAGLRAVVSRSAPTCAAVKRARRANIGIIGFLRGKRFNLYT